MINSTLNRKLHEANNIYNQYLTLINSKKSSIPADFQADAEKAQIDFLMFSLDSVIQLIATHCKHDENKEHIYSQVEKVREILDEIDSSNPKRCVKQLEEASSIWSQLCY